MAAQFVTTRTWQGGTTGNTTNNQQFGRSQNWTGGSFPNSADTEALFGPANEDSVNVNVSATVGRLTFLATAPAYTFTNTGTLTLGWTSDTTGLGGGALGITNAANAVHSFANAFALAVDQTWRSSHASGGGLTFTGTVNLAGSNLTLDPVNVANTITLGAVTGAGDLIKQGAGLLVLNGARSGTGATLLNAGTMRLGAAERLDNTSALTVAAGATLQLNNFNETVGSLAGAGTVTLGSGTLTAGGNGTSTTFSGALNGTGGLTKAGAGTLTVAANQTYTGATTVTGGVLSVGSLANGGISSGIGQSDSTASNLVLNGGTLRYTGGAVSTNRRFTLGTSGGGLDASGSGALTFANINAVVQSGTNTARTLTLTGTNTGNNTLAAALGNNGSGALSLLKEGTGTWVLTGNNTFAGATTVSAGTLRATTNNSLGSGAGALTVATGGRLVLDGGVTLARTGGISLSGAGPGSTGGALFGGGTAGQTSQITGGFTLAGNTTITAGAGLFRVGNDLTLASGWDVFNLGGHTLTLHTPDAPTVTPVYGLAPDYALDPANLYLAGRFIGTTGGITKTGAGTAILTGTLGASTFTGATRVQGGRLIVDGAGYTNYLSGTNVIVGNDSSPGTAGSAILQLGQLASPPAENYMVGTFTSIDGFQTSSTDMTLFEDGLLLMNQSSIGLRTVTLRGGEIDMGTQFDPLLTITDGLTGLASAQTARVHGGNLALGGNNFVFNIADGAATQDVRIEARVQNGVGFTAADAAVGPVKTGAGTLVFSGNNTYQGITQVQQGVLRIEHNTALGQTGGLGNFPSGTVVSSGAQLQLANNITVNNETLTLNGTGVGGTGALLNAAGDNQWRGRVFVDTASRIESAAGTTLTIASPNGPGAVIISGAAGGRALTFGGAGNTVVNGGIDSNLVGLTKDGTGTVTFAGVNSYGGATNVTAGILRLTNSSALSGSGVTVTSGATLQLAQTAAAANITVVGVPTTLSGTGVGGIGALHNLTGANTYNGSLTTAADASVGVASGTSLTLAGTLTGTHTLSLTGPGATTLSGSGANTVNHLRVTDGNVSFNKTAGTAAAGGAQLTIGDGIGSPNTANVTLAKSNQIGDTTAVTVAADGRLQLNNFSETIGSLAGSGRVTTGTGNLLTGGNNTSTTFSGVIDGSGSLTKTGSGTFTLTGANTFTGGVNVNAGTLALGASNTLVASTTATLTGSGTLALQAGYAQSLAALITNSNTTVSVGAGSTLTVTSTGDDVMNGAFVGTGTLAFPSGTGNVTIGNDIAFNGTLEFGGGTLFLGGNTVDLGELHITGNSILDFGSSTASILNTGTLRIDAGVTVFIANWIYESDFFSSQNWINANMVGSPTGPYDQTGVQPMTQITFAGWTPNNTVWQSWDNQIRPIPEPSTYGALLVGFLATAFSLRRPRRD